MILSKDEENDNEVRRGDQDKINEFGRLNARLTEVQAEAKLIEVGTLLIRVQRGFSSRGLTTWPLRRTGLGNGLRTSFIESTLSHCIQITHSSNSSQTHMEKIEDASTELMMGGGDTVLLRLGDAMFEVEEDDATEHCEKEADRQQERLDKLREEEADILQRQGGLKKVLYSRFGKSINLET